MKITKEIFRCRNCTFLGISMDGMECNHPHWDDKGAYDGMIINQENVEHIPEKCPLKTEELIVTYKLK